VLASDKNRWLKNSAKKKRAKKEHKKSTLPSYKTLMVCLLYVELYTSHKVSNKIYDEQSTYLESLENMKKESL